MPSASGHCVQQAGIAHGGGAVVVPYFPSLTNTTPLADVLPIRVCVAREHSRFLVKTQLRRNKHVHWNHPKYGSKQEKDCCAKALVASRSFCFRTYNFRGQGARANHWGSKRQCSISVPRRKRTISGRQVPNPHVGQL